MILLTLILTNILWVGYSLTEGIREGFYWHYENKSKKVCDFNINPVFNLQRCMVLILTSGFLVHTLNYHSLLNILCMIIIVEYTVIGI